MSEARNVAQHPLQAFVDWLDSLQPVHRGEIALFVMTAHRAANGPTDLRAAEQELRAEIDAQRPGSMRIVGFTLYLRAAVDYFYAYKGSRAYWDGFLRKQRNIKAQLEQSGEDPGLLEMTNRMIDEIPLKREQWIKTIAKWGEIRNAALSDAALNASCPFVFM